MCGIAGYKTAHPVDEQWLLKMVEALRHRGPDSAGYYHTSGYHVGMRRLSINDLSTGDQPLYNEDQSVVLIYNGEIYNYPELRHRLEAKGYRFRTYSDGEVICHLYAEYGDSLFEQLDGMFAAALWIEPEQKLILARDIPGEKPLYYARLADNGLVFASEIKSLVQFPSLDLSLNYQALWDFPTFLWIPEPDTAYTSIKALPRSHLLIANPDGIRIQHYQNRFNQQPIALSDEDVIAETRRVVTEAVHSRLLSDVPVGSFLSSGLDSSIVATLAAQKLDHLTTFSIGFENVADPYHGRADESQYAAQYARQIGSTHHILQVTADDFRHDLEEFCHYGDQPFAVSSGLGILAIAQRAHEEGIKVLLSGDGADECFGGYSWYFHLKEIDELVGTVAASSSHMVSFQNFGMDVHDRLRVMREYAPPWRAWAWHYYAAETEKAALFNRETFDATQSSLRYFSAFQDGKPWSAEDYIRQDRMFYFPYEMLRKVDRMTMAHSVEGRVPFAAPAVLAHADKLRFAHMVRQNKLKWVLRQAFTDVLPPEILDRPKHGFNVPIDNWLNGKWADLVEAAFAPDSALARYNLIHAGSLEQARMLLHDSNRLSGHTVFCYVMLNMWLETDYGRNHC